MVDSRECKNYAGLMHKMGDLGFRDGKIYLHQLVNYQQSYWIAFEMSRVVFLRKKESFYIGSCNIRENPSNVCFKCSMNQPVDCRVQKLEDN